MGDLADRIRNLLLEEPGYWPSPLLYPPGIKIPPDVGTERDLPQFVERVPESLQPKPSGFEGVKRNLGSLGWMPQKPQCHSRTQRISTHT